jgi:hypothetical protein
MGCTPDACSQLSRGVAARELLGGLRRVSAGEGYPGASPEKYSTSPALPCEYTNGGSMPPGLLGSRITLGRVEGLGRPEKLSASTSTSRGPVPRSNTRRGTGICCKCAGRGPQISTTSFKIEEKRTSERSVTVFSRACTTDQREGDVAVLRGLEISFTGTLRQPSAADTLLLPATSVGVNLIISEPTQQRKLRAAY